MARFTSRWHWAWLLLSGCTLSVAQPSSSSDFLDMSLEELVDYRLMSMSRKEQRVADMAAAAHVVTAEEIRQSGATSIPEALRLVPGISVAQISSNRWAVTARGFNDRLAGKLLVLVDGRSIYSPFLAGVLWENQDVMMEDVERIEVIRGPGAALWGTNAMNGVINIITRTAASTQGNLVSTTVGTDGLSTVSMRHGGELSQGGYYKFYAKQANLGDSPRRDNGLNGNDAMNQKRVGLRLEPEMDHGQLTLQADLYQGKSGDGFNLPALYPYSDPNTPYIRETQLSSRDQGVSLRARYAWRGEQGAENILQTYADHEASKYTGLWGNGTTLANAGAGQPATVTTIGGQKTDVDVDFQQRRTWDQHDFIWGLNIRHTDEELFSPQAGPYIVPQSTSRRYSYSAFVHDEITMVPDRFKFIWGSKFERDGLTGWNVQPNIRTLYTPNANEAYWSALSHSVRSPRRSQSQSSIDAASGDAAAFLPKYNINAPIPANALTVLGRFSPNTDAKIKAEHAYSLEGGWRRQFSNFLSVDTALFYTRYNNLSAARVMPINMADVNTATNCVMGGGTNCYLVIPGYNTNEDRARSWGGEAGLEWHVRSWWKLQAFYNYVRILGEYTGDFLGDNALKNLELSTPRHQAMLNNQWRLAPDWQLNARLRYQSSTGFYPLAVLNMEPQATKVSAYTGLDLRLAWQYNRQVELSVMGRNLLKDRHTEFISSMPYTQAFDVRRSVLFQAVARF